MARAERDRGGCPVCSKDCAITEEGGVRHHLTKNPSFQAGPDSRKCRGVGQPPAEEHCENCGHDGHGYADMLRDGGTLLDLKDCTEEAWPGTACACAREIREMDTGSETVTGYVCRIKPGPGGCGRPVELTANGRARSHLNNAGHPCGGGSDWPLAVDGTGNRTDTAPLADGRTSMFLEISGPGTVLDLLGFDPQDPDGPGEPSTSPAPFDVTHDFSDDVTQTYGVHPGTLETCTEPGCCTHPQGFVYGDDGKGNSGEACLLCGAEPPEPCNHDYVYGNTDENGDDVWVCEHCEEREPEAVTRMKAPRRAQVRLRDLDEGDLFRRHTRPEPVGSLVFRVTEHESSGVISATVVSAGPYADRTGRLTDLQEEITCTDLDGSPRARRDRPPGPGTASSFRSSPAPSPNSDRGAATKTWKPQQPSSSVRPSGPRSSTPSTPMTTAPDPGSKPSTKATAQLVIATTSSPGTRSGRMETTGTSTRTAPVTSEAQAAADFLTAGSGSYGEAEAKHGRYGRYRLVHPATGKTVEWTRATTFAKSISDTFTLSQWGKRNVLVGATMRPDIVALAHGKDVSADREQLNGWTEDLEQAAGSKVAANLGTAVHSFTERIDRNWERRWEVFETETPNEFKPHVQAYIVLLEDYGLEPVPHMIEFSTGVLQYEVMGTSDNCYRTTKHIVLRMPRGEVRLSPGEYVVGDKKTGKDLSYGWQEICIQLALYVQGVNTQGVYDWEYDTWEPDPLSRFAEPGTKVREDVGVILHLPVDPRSKKNPAIYGVDLESGWSATVLCERVRTWRKLRNLAGPVAVVDEADLHNVDPATHKGLGPEGLAKDARRPEKAVRPPTFRERAEAVTSKTEASQVYQDAIAAKVPVTEARELIEVMQEKIAQIAEPGGAKV